MDAMVVSRGLQLVEEKTEGGRGHRGREVLLHAAAIALTHALKYTGACDHVESGLQPRR